MIGTHPEGYHAFIVKKIRTVKSGDIRAYCEEIDPDPLNHSRLIISLTLIPNHNKVKVGTKLYEKHRTHKIQLNKPPDLKEEKVQFD